MPEKPTVRVDVQLELHVPGLTTTEGLLPGLDEESHQRVDDLVHQLIEAADPSRHYDIVAWVRSTEPIADADAEAS